MAGLKRYPRLSRPHGIQRLSQSTRIDRKLGTDFQLSPNKMRPRRRHPLRSRQRFPESEGVMAFKAKVTPAQLGELRRRFRELPEMSHEERGRIVTKEWPTLTTNTLETYSRVCLGVTDKVFDLFLSGNLTFAVLEELCGWKSKDQDFIIDSYLEQKWTPEILRRIRRYRKENDWGYDECIGKATGKIDVMQPRSGSPRKSLDSLLSEIADKGTRWRAMVQQVMEMIDTEEAQAGVHEALFIKVCLLREIIGNQYDFVNSRFNRYINAIRKRLHSGGVFPCQEGHEEGEINGHDSGASEGRVRGEEGAPCEDGPSVPHSSA